MESEPYVDAVREYFDGNESLEPLYSEAGGKIVKMLFNPDVA